MIKSFINSTESFFSGMLFNIFGSIILSYIFAFFLTNTAYDPSKWGLLSIPPSFFDMFIRKPKLLGAIFIIGYMLIFIGGFVSTYIAKHAKLMHSCIASIISVLLGSFIAKGFFVKFHIVMFLIVIPVTILGYVVNHVFINRKIICNDIKQIKMDRTIIKSPCIIHINLLIAIVQTYICSVSIATIIFFHKNFLTKLFDFLPMSLGNIFIWMPIIMLIVSLLLLFDAYGRKEKLIAISLWLFCIVGVGVFMIENLSHISLK